MYQRDSVWMGEGSEHRRVISRLGRQNTGPELLEIGFLFRRQADLFEKHFQIVQGRESQSDRSDLPRVALSEQLEKALDANLCHPDETITASSI